MVALGIGHKHSTAESLPSHDTWSSELVLEGQQLPLSLLTGLQDGQKESRHARMPHSLQAQAASALTVGSQVLEISMWRDHHLTDSKLQAPRSKGIWPEVEDRT